MKVKSFTYERNWSGKYYRQRLLPSMETMDNHVARMLDDDWEILTQTPHTGNSRSFGLSLTATRPRVLGRRYPVSTEMVGRDPEWTGPRVVSVDDKIASKEIPFERD